MSRRSPTVRAATFATVVIAGLVGCAARLPSMPGVYEQRSERVTILEHTLNVTCVKPVRPRSPLLLVLFATGDAGFMGASGEILEHMAREGYAIVAYDSREAIAPSKHSGKPYDIPVAAEAVEQILVQSRRLLGLPETTPVIVTGFSRGANLVVFAAGVERLRSHLAGAVAIALTRETDFLQAPDPENRTSAVQVDEKGRIQTYPAIVLAGSLPFAVIQSAGDKYVPARESRQLFGPDGPARRLYEVEARNHGFGGGRELLLRELDDALAWIEERSKSR